MQWVIDAYCQKKNKMTHKVSRTKKSDYDRHGRNLRYCNTCNNVWEPDYQWKKYIHKYKDFPTNGIKRKECKYCE